MLECACFRLASTTKPTRRKVDHDTHVNERRHLYFVFSFGRSTTLLAANQAACEITIGENTLTKIRSYKRPRPLLSRIAPREGIGRIISHNHKTTNTHHYALLVFWPTETHRNRLQKQQQPQNHHGASPTKKESKRSAIDQKQQQQSSPTLVCVSAIVRRHAGSVHVSVRAQF